MSFRDDIMKGNYELNLPSRNNKKKKKSKFVEEIESGNYKIELPERIKVEEIAPVKEDKRTWFTGGAFSDGYQFGDITKTLTGTVTDVTQDIYAGIIEMPEKVIDAGAILFGKGAELFGNDKLADSTSEFIQKDLIDSQSLSYRMTDMRPGGWAADTITGIGDDRLKRTYEGLLGKTTEQTEKEQIKTDSLAESGGQLLGTIGLQTVGVPWQVTMGTTTFGAEAENALKNDASYNEALVSSTISTGAELIFENLFKIPGIKATGSGKVGNKLASKLVDGFTNSTTTRNIVNWGINAMGEGFEEVGTEFFQNLGQALTYENEVTLQEFAESEEAREKYIMDIAKQTFGEEAMEGYSEAFVGGTVLGGAFGTPNTVSMTQQGRDINTGLTTNEQLVVDEVANKKIQEASKDKELSKKEQAKIKEEVQQDLERGLIDTADIESALGGETYTKYKESDARLTTLKTEIAKLNEKVNTEEITLKEMKRLESLKQRLNDIDTASIQTQLQQEVQEKTASDTYLQRSYYEKGQRSKQFTYEAREDMSDVEKLVYDSASKVMNNTTRSHEVVDAVAKIAKDRGSKYVFVNNEMLKRNYEKLGKENTTIDGYVNKKGETILNIDSPKILNKIVGHETTHLLEGTNEYKLLQEAVKEYAITKGEYDTKLQSLTKMYEGTDANIEAEITSDLVGDYLFTDENFVNHLSAKQPNVFKKVYDYIKHLVKQFTAGSKEARQLEKVKYRFEQAYRNGQKSTVLDGQKSGQNTQKATQSLADNKGRTLAKEQQEYFKDTKVKDKNGNLITMYHGTRADFNTFDAERSGQNYEGGWSMSGKGFYFTNDPNVANEYGESSIEDGDTNVKEVYLDVKNPFYAYDSYTEELASLKEKYNLDDQDLSRGDKLIRALNQNGYDSTKVLQELGYDGVIESTRDGEIDDVVVFNSNQIKNVDNAKPTSNPDIRYSLTDNQGRELTKEQQEYFKDSKVRDDEGNLVTVYHGSNTYGFTVFDGAEGDGNYKFGDKKIAFYTSSKNVADSYISPKKSGGIYEGYLNLKNPLIVDAEGSYWNKIDYYGDGSLLTSTNEIVRDAMYGGELDSDGKFVPYDGVIFKNLVDVGGNFKGKLEPSDVYVAFNPNQFKNIDNTNPTENPDIRYSLSEEGKLVDNKGNEVKLETTDAGNHNNLMAIHNLSEAKLKGILELGGFPVPSIAITDTNKFAHNDFGEISVLFDKATIDPANKENLVYGSDVYSPRFPQTVNEIDKVGAKQVADTLGMSLNQFEANYENMPIEQVTDRLLRNERIIDKYLESKNITVEPIYKQFSPEKSGVSAHHIESFLNNHEEFKNGDIVLRNIDYEAYNNEIKQIHVDNLVEAGATIEDAQDLYKDFGQADSIKFLMDVRDYKKLQNSGQEIDEYATKNEKERKIDIYSEEYKNFVTNIISPAFGGKYIRNSKDVFTPSGNRRSFKQLYDAYNLDNVVKNIKGKVRGEEGFFYGAGNIRSQITPQFKSIAEIKASEGKLVTNSQMEEIKNDINSDLNNLSVVARNFGGHDYDSYGFALNEIAGLKKITPDITRKTLEEYGFKNVPDILVEKSIEFLEKLKNAPTEYFEAKPQRAVGLDEIQALVIPNNIGAELKQQLNDAGINVIEYDPNIEGDRQAKINQFDDLKFSLSNSDYTETTQRGTRGEDVKLQEAIAPIQQTINDLSEQLTRIENKIKVNEDDYAPVSEANLPGLEQQYSKDFQTIDDDLAPVEQELDNVEAEPNAPTKDLFDTRDYAEVGDRKINAYQYDNPEVRPYFQEAAEGMLYDLNNSIKGERIYNDELYYDSGGEKGFDGTKRFTADDIAEMLDGMNGKYKMSYDDIRKGLNAIIEDHGAENNAASKRIEFYLDQRLRNGYTEIGTGGFVPPNQEYINLVNNKANEQAYNEYYSNIPIDESLAPLEVEENVSRETKEKYLAIEPEPRIPTKEPKMIRVKPDAEEQKIAEILTEEPKTENDRNKRKWAIIKANVLDKGIVFEDVSLKHKNRELMGKWDYTITSEARGQNAIGQGHYEYDPYSKTSKQVSKPLNDIRAEIENSGHAAEFYEYIYHKHNVDRMSLERKAQEKIRAILRTSDYSHDELMKLANKHITEKTSIEDVKAIEFAKEYKALFEVKNKPVFGESVTAQQSQEIVNKYESTHPEFMDFAKDIYDYTNADRQVLVNNGVISQETADLWQSMYPHYVPIRRAGHEGSAINVPLDTGRTGVNAPIKRATGGNKDILPLFDTMALRTLQTYRAAAKNDFGVELMNTIGTKINSQKTSVDEVIDGVEKQEELLQEGKNGQKPTFTVFENGEKVTFEITKDMYDALKPVSDSSLLSKTFAVPNKISSFHRGVLTEYNPVFMLTNGIKDAQDILINSQHPAKTYAKVPEAFTQLVAKGYWYQEYMNNGGEQNSYFDSQDNTFKTENKGIKKLLDIPPLSTISKLNNFIEMTPRLAEYIASRQSGRSIQVSMLDAARVTTNFKAGGNLTKFLNRNGATFLNASVQGAMQQVRNFREAKANGARGWMNLATKFAIAGLPAVLLNAFLWDDDEEYEELSDYVKQNYYIVGKTEDGKFIRIPKGRTLAVIQEAAKQISDVATGNDEADLKSFIELALNNLAPNNPIENNILSPIVQVASNKTWYGEDLVPTRLQDLPEAEQFDESTDAFSKWLGEKTNVSPVKINYLLDQYTGGVGDVVLPMMTPEAESGAETTGEKLLAPLNNKFTTDAVLNNQNVSDFYDKSDELTTEAKKSKATDEDVLRNKYINFAS